MPEHFRSLIVVSFIAAIVFSLARRSVVEVSMSDADYRRRRNLWFAITALVFLSHNFWVFTGGTLLLALLVRKRENNILALYFTLALAVPAYSLQLPGFAFINYLFDVDHVRMLSLGLLLPTALYLRGEKLERSRWQRMADWSVGAYIGWVVLRYGMDTSMTETARVAFNRLTDVILPFYVASRYFRSVAQFREAMAGFVIVAVIIGAIAMFESTRYWLVYQSLRTSLRLPAAAFIEYLERGGTGLLRAQASLLQPIVVGYVMMFGLAMLTLFAGRLRPRWLYVTAFLSIVGGMVASLSRGPWVGAAVMLTMMFILDPSVGRRAARLAGAGVLILVVLFVTPYGATIIEYLPFVGSVENANVDYRTRLFEVSMQVIAQSPWIGDLSYLSNPLMEQMRQGQGIIDIVNSYLQVILPYGAIGLVLFVLPFVTALRALRSLLRRHADLEPEIERTGRVLLSLLIGTLVTIATVSSIGVIPNLYWILLGMCLSYVSVAYPETVEAPAKKADRSRTPRPRARKSLSEGY